MKRILRKISSSWFAAALLLATIPALADSTASSEGVKLIHAAPGESGGLVSGGLVTAEVTTGSAIAGGVSSVSTISETGGFTGQLYDATSLTVSADPGTTLNEGEAVQLITNATLDDGTTLNTGEAVWTINSGPIASVSANGFALAASVNATSAADVEGALGSATGNIALSILNLPYQPNNLSWEGNNGPYTVYFGTDTNALTEITGLPTNIYTPGQLEMGTTYYWRVLDMENNDITPGGNGSDPISFTTSVFQPDMRVGNKGNPATHRGNNIYNLSGGGQLMPLKLKGTRAGKLYFSIENDGDADDGHRFRGTKAKRSSFKSVNYYRLSGGRANVTGAAIRSGFLHSNVTPGSIVSYQIQAKAKGKKKASQLLKLSAISAEDSRGADLGKAKLIGTVKKKK